MKLTIEKAMELLEEVRPEISDVRWINHSICVGNTAARIAKALGLDPNYAASLGYVHDIGKCVNKEDYEWHDVSGYYYLLEKGIDEEDAMICLTHSYINGDYTCVAGGLVDKHELRCEKLQNHDYTYYEKIINLCDLMCTTELMSMEKRLIDLLIRKGNHSNTKHHLLGAQKLKEEFDILLGHDLYLLFPEITGVKEAFLLYNYDECGIHLSIDNELSVSYKKALERKEELKKEYNDDWDIKPMKINY
jgi:putative nucleotidyltransferase with HDIG domain